MSEVEYPESEDDCEFFHALADVFANVMDSDEDERRRLHECADRCADGREDGQLPLFDDPSDGEVTA